MKVGVDGVLLGAWVRVPDSGRILDIGTGTGLLALMLAQRSPKAHIDALEIDDDACKEARHNVMQSPWPERIRVHHSPVQQFAGQTNLRFDLLVSNPPFFERSTKAPCRKRNAARHDDDLPLPDLLDASINLLKPEGRLALVWPYERAAQLEGLAQEKGLFTERITRVRPNSQKKFHRILVELGFRNIPVKENELELHAAGENGYSAAYRNLTRDFYLAF